MSTTSDVVTNSPEQPPIAAQAGLRLAGAILILNGVFVLFEKMVLADKSASTSITSVIIDVVLGLALIKRNVRFLKWTILRAVLGAIFFGGLQLYNHQPIPAIVQIAFSLSVLNLLIGNPGARRLAASAFVAFLVFSLEGVGLHTELTGRNILGRWILELKEHLTPLNEARVVGVDHPYSMVSPGTEWLQRSREDAQKDNQLADIWLINPTYDAHLYVIGEQLEEGYVFVLDKLTEGVIKNAKKNMSEFTITERRSVASKPAEGEHVPGDRYDQWHAPHVPLRNFRFRAPWVPGRLLRVSEVLQARGGGVRGRH